MPITSIDPHEEAYSLPWCVLSFSFSSMSNEKVWLNFEQCRVIKLFLDISLIKQLVENDKLFLNIKNYYYLVEDFWKLTRKQ